MPSGGVGDVSRSRLVLAFVLIAVGAVWIGQGSGVLRGSSFMVGDPAWAVAGGACVAFGTLLLARDRRRPRE